MVQHVAVNTEGLFSPRSHSLPQTRRVSSPYSHLGNHVRTELNSKFSNSGIDRNRSVTRPIGSADLIVFDSFWST
jgi:hypothetical protein